METPLESRLAAELEPGERLLWTGRPKQGFALRPVDALLIPFSIMWGGFAIFWEGAAIYLNFIHRPPPPHAPALFMVFWGIPFVLFGLYFMFGRFMVDTRMRANTIYGITDRRVLILSGLMTTTVRTFALRNLTDISVSERRGGIGTITFGPHLGASPSSYGSVMPGGGSYSRPCFDLIERPREVYETLRAAQRKFE